MFVTGVVLGASVMSTTAPTSESTAQFPGTSKPNKNGKNLTKLCILSKL